MKVEPDAREASDREALLRDISGLGAFELTELDPDDLFAPGSPAVYCPRVQEMLAADEALAPVVATWIDALHADDRERVLQAHRDHRDVRGEVLELEYRVITQHGDIHWWNERCRIEPSRRAGRLRLLAVVRDITAERRNLERMRRHADLLNQTQASARVGGWELETATGELQWTVETKRIHEVPEDFVPNLAEAINFYAPEHVPVITEAVQRCLKGEPFDVELDLITATGKRLSVHAVGRPYFEDGKVTRLYGAFRDISESKRREDELRLQLEVIARQESAIKAMSTPIIQLWDNIITLPVIGTLDSERSTQIMDRLLTEVVRVRARFAILDLTGVDAIDTTTADQLVRITRAVGLLGAKGLLCGLTPSVAQTLTELGVDLSPFITHRNLQEALQRCIRELARRATS